MVILSVVTFSDYYEYSLYMMLCANDFIYRPTVYGQFVVVLYKCTDNVTFKKMSPCIHVPLDLKYTFFHWKHFQVVCFVQQ